MTNQETASRELMVFLCHGSEDKARVREIYSDLLEDGAEPWLDEKNILPGQDWDTEIRKAVRKCDAILVCLSSTAANKEGYIQREIKIALDIADEKPEGTIFIIPVRLEECEVPHRLSRWQWVDYFQEDGYEKILGSLRIRANSLKNVTLPSGESIKALGKPLEEASGRILYRSRNIRVLLQRARNKQISIDNIPRVSPEIVIGISFEAMDEALAPFTENNRRLQEKETILRLVGIVSPYHEWGEKNGKTHCFRNNEEERDEMTEIQMTSVSSSNIAAIGYDSATEVLRVIFLNGNVYEYYGVPQHLYEGLMSANSHGSYLNSQIKARNYSYEQIS
jgi:TIR domain/KTSC domain